MTALSRYWPLFRLRLRSGPLELRLPTDDDLPALVDLAAGGVHPPEEMPFLHPWTDVPPGDFERSMLQHYWRCRAEWAPERWSAGLVVLRDGEVVGVQNISATDFAVRRTVTTGSWLGRRHQGQGIGTRMRQAVLALAFEGLGTLEASSGSFEDNPSSEAVSRKLGYRPGGHRVHVRRGARVRELLFVMDRETWLASTRPEVEIDGLGSCRELFGA